MPRSWIVRSVLIFFALILSLRVGANGQLALALLAGVSILVGLFVRDHFKIAISVLGFSVALLPCLGSPILLVFSVFLLALSAPKISFARWGVPFLSVCAASSLVMCVRDFWAHDLLATLTRAGSDPILIWINLRESLRISPIPGILAFEHSLRWLTICLLGAVLYDQRELLLAFIRSLAFGLVVGVLLGLADQAQLLPFTLPTPGAFWLATARSAFTLTDPNALGIVALLVVMATPLLLRLEALSNDRKFNRVGVLICSALALFAGTYSASRTFFVGLIVWLALLLWLKSRRRCLIAIACGVALIIALNLLLLSQPGDYENNLVSRLPLGFARIINSLSVREFGQAIASRVIFNIAAFEMWLDHPIFGVGIGQFVTAALPYLPGQAGWSDNANNFYLGVLAETGLFGFAALVVPLSRLRLVLIGDSVEASAARLIVVFCITLLLGPHLAFDEVALTIGAISALIEPRSVLMARRRFFVLALAMALLANYSSPFGLYPAELDGNQWTARHARFERIANQNGEVVIAFQVLNPAETDYPIMIRASSARGEVRELVLERASAETRQISFRCDSATQWYIQRPCHLTIRLDTSATWVPAMFDQGVDRRNLGVRLINPAN